MTTIDLHVTELGEQGPRVVFCHGLFGQGKNWTTIAKALADNHRVTLVDMPNHGRSGWTEHLDYVEMANQVATLFDASDPVALIGHSMGGKAAMLLALLHPDLVERLVVVDMSPVDYHGQSEFAGYIAGMQAMDLSAIESRADADAALFAAAPNRTVRSFLLQNLRRDTGTSQDPSSPGWRWMPNLDLLGRELSVLGGWPEEQLGDTAPYDSRVLWIGGADSPYVKDAYAPAMEKWFPRVRRVTIKGAGHWVHSQQPEVFTEVVRRFLDAD
ncbi:alpha/beta fold hydrolase [Nocardioides sp. AE5]|uniref:alpha/beta fold hydrolase n=1 Tax=Nocardioides sp. AE5 TaxID=2962573 RepID=UPI002880FD64|nr:alpha/beta fold hydrolase [Nocardioides sp. AE5]MDT0201019.1 alpha/beta fold hydrolase [Nocardioides sp. AE5]